MPTVRNQNAINFLLYSPGGTTGRYTTMKGERVAQHARALLASKVRTGRLVNSVKVRAPQRIGEAKRGLTVQVGSFGVRYAKWVSEGTGVYGPHGHPIVPRRAKFLRFELNGRVVYATSVRGVPPFPFMQRALHMEMG